MNSIYDADLLASLPQVLKNDDTMNALAQVIADELHILLNQTKLAVVYANIDSLPEEVLDVLAYDFKVDWYDYDYSLEEKRETIKNSWNVHRKLGTKYAVETAISAIYKDTTVQEWWEYGGEPYHFKLLLDATYEGVAQEKHRRVLERVDYYKNLRSHLDAIDYIAIPEGTCRVYSAIAYAGVGIRITVEVNIYGMG